MTALVRLYPRRWRQRYGAEFEQLLADLTDSGGRAGWRVALDVARGALDAHIHGRYGMRRLFAVPAVRRGVFDGVILSALAASGWTSMRAYLTVEQLLGGMFLVVALGLVGAMLGLLGAAVFRRRQPQPARPNDAEPLKGQRSVGRYGYSPAPWRSSLIRT